MATRASAPARRRAGGTDDGDVDPALPQKKRARHRLIGAVVLCGVAAVVVPLLLDSEPARPPSDVAIVIPSKDTPLPPRAGEPKGAVARGAADAPPADPKPADAKPSDAKPSDAKPAAEAAKPGDARTADAKAADPRSADPARAAEARPAEPAAGSKPSDAKAAARAEPARKDAAGKDEIAQLAESAQARTAAPKAGEPRYLLQVGAYAGESGASAAVERVGALGLRAFTEKVKTDAGDRIRVRVGPFATREAAEQARSKLQAAGVQAAMIAPPPGTAPPPAPAPASSR
ncbi:MAG: hypothetical protein RJA99_1443 [Pseudomonadota bacterium]